MGPFSKEEMLGTTDVTESEIASIKMGPFSKEEMLGKRDVAESEIASIEMGPFSKEEMLGTRDVEILHQEIGKYWNENLAPRRAGDCSACEATVANLTKRLQESQESEKKLALEVEDYKKTKPDSTKNSLLDQNDCEDNNNEKKLLLEEAEVYKRKLLALVLDSEKRAAKVEYRYVYVPFTATHSVAYFVTKIIQKVVKWTTTKWRRTQDCKTDREGVCDGCCRERVSI